MAPALGWAVALLLAATAPATSLAYPGELDLSFGQDGHTYVQANRACLRFCVEFSGSYADALAIQPDGGMVLGGENSFIGAGAGSESAPGAIVRLSPNGTVDTSFGGAGGIVDTPFGVTEIYADGGELRVVGEAAGGHMIGTERFTSGGALDGGYGPGGVRWRPTLEAGEGGVYDTAGRLLKFVTVQVAVTETEEATTQLGVIRLLPSGKPDLTFGHDGFMQLPDSKAAGAVELVPQRNGGVVAAIRENAESRVAKPSYCLLLERLTPTGRVDRSFGRRGIARVPCREQTSGTAIVSSPDGDMLVVSGERSEPHIEQGASPMPEGPMPEGESYLTVAAYGHMGSLDRRFGRKGISRVRLPDYFRYARLGPNAIAFDALGDLIVVGSEKGGAVDTPRPGVTFLARYTARGRDCAFGGGGVVIDRGMSAPAAVALQADGRIVVAGSDGNRFAAARYLGGGSPQTCPGEGAPPPQTPSRKRRMAVGHRSPSHRHR
jgi:uncharacterized delta-60 repeat protein